MYHEETIIDGVLHYRNHPDADWTAYTIEQLSRKCQQAEEEARDLRRRLRAVREALDS